MVNGGDRCFQPQSAPNKINDVGPALLDPSYVLLCKNMCKKGDVGKMEKWRKVGD